MSDSVRRPTAKPSAPAVPREFQRALRETFATPAGRRALYWIMRCCGYQGPNAFSNRQTGDILKASLEFNEGRRALYLEIRKHLDRDTLTEVEIDFQMLTTPTQERPPHVSD